MVVVPDGGKVTVGEAAVGDSVDILGGRGCTVGSSDADADVGSDDEDNDDDNDDNNSDNDIDDNDIDDNDDDDNDDDDDDDDNNDDSTMTWFVSRKTTGRCYS